MAMSNNLTATGSARPTLQITSPVLVTLAGSAAANGTYTFRLLRNGRASYNLEGEVDSGVAHAIQWNGSQWLIFGDSGEDLYVSTDDVPFPWLVSTWSLSDFGANPAPTVSVSPNQSGELIFNGSSNGLAGSGPLFS